MGQEQQRLETTGLIFNIMLFYINTANVLYKMFICKVTTN